MRKMVDQDRGSFIREVSVHSIEPYQMCQLYPLFIKLIGFHLGLYRSRTSANPGRITDHSNQISEQSCETGSNGENNIG